MNDIEITDNSGLVADAIKKAIKRGLDAIGKAAEGHAKKNITTARVVDTGRLLNSIAYKVKDDAVYIGTNVPYAIYIENGTGIYAADGRGRKDPWVYMDDKGKFHMTKGVKPVRYLKRSATENKQEYRDIMEESMKNA